MPLDTANFHAVKRAACDRCHGQKLRCIPDEGLGKCNRCRAAKAECIYSALRRAGRPPSSKHAVTSRSEASHHHASDRSTRRQQDSERALASDWPLGTRISSTSKHHKRLRQQQQQQPQQQQNHNHQLSASRQRPGASDVTNPPLSVVNLTSISNSTDGFSTAGGSAESLNEEALTLSAFFTSSDSDFTPFIPCSDDTFTYEAHAPPDIGSQGHARESGNLHSHQSLWTDAISQTADLGPFDQASQQHESESVAPFYAR